jgi:hypothetical protein
MSEEEKEDFRRITGDWSYGREPGEALPTPAPKRLEAAKEGSEASDEDGFEGVRAWLEGLGLSQYAEAFRREAIELSLLPTLTEQDLRALGVEALGHRKRLLASIARLEGELVAGRLQSSRAARPGSAGEPGGESAGSGHQVSEERAGATPEPTTTAQPVRTYVIFAMLILSLAAVALFAHECKSGLSISTTAIEQSKSVRQNGEIPGYADCIRRLAASCPRCPIKQCCDEVGGRYRQEGSGFPICEK